MKLPKSYLMYKWGGYKYYKREIEVVGFQKSYSSANIIASQISNRTIKINTNIIKRRVIIRPRSVSTNKGR